MLCPSMTCDSCYELLLSFLVNKCSISRFVVCVFQIWKTRDYRSSIAVDLFQYEQLERLTMVVETCLIAIVLLIVLFSRLRQVIWLSRYLL